ncbi:GTPase of the mitochondrial inner membrane that associates with the large ribosomal subunit [Cladophialophora chaetospira]|uniref:GTPase of the mitochondrial inner membrane that associates with the large ribosomal subunit n=1 Tax=Cladophialophora chaetospira TaxID=386627 RepID=A0AA39CJS7_9EURO|nr:GTPase of the mitochondrial inner membrane that associates with the large ribosomal subunit [Cladophialophora chaetospira]
MTALQGTFLPFLYPCLFRPSTSSLRSKAHLPRHILQQCTHQTRHLQTLSPSASNVSPDSAGYQPPPPLTDPSTHLNPTPEDYSRSIFIDKCILSISSGSGGSGCVSFLRDVHISDGPPNGGDGGSGGSIYIQAVPGQTSLHKIARRGIIKAGRGIGGQGKSQGGRRGEDICIQVPVGTVVREIWRSDPLAEEELRLKELRGKMTEEEILTLPPEESGLRNRFVIYAGATTTADKRSISANLPALTSNEMKPRRSHLSILAPPAPITLDLSTPNETPILLAAGAVGGLGNPHFASKADPKPKYATKGELGVRIKLELELKLLADVGLVGLPNAGKSTFTRAISKSRTRIGDWAFTTLSPTIGTVILDDNVGRPLVRSGVASTDPNDVSIIPRTQFTVADIPGLIEDAHLDKGLGLSFLRHIERARILAFVVDLSAGDAVAQLKALWKEVSEYENLRDRELNSQSEKHGERVVKWSPFEAQSPLGPKDPSNSVFNEAGEGMSIFPSGSNIHRSSKFGLEPLRYPPISAKPWFVIGTKADIPSMNSSDNTANPSSLLNYSPEEGRSPSTTQANFLSLAQYMKSVEAGQVEHPSQKKNGWRTRVAAIPVSAIRGEGIDKVIRYTAGVLDSLVVGR